MREKTLLIFVFYWLHAEMTILWRYSHRQQYSSPIAKMNFPFPICFFKCVTRWYRVTGTAPFCVSSIAIGLELVSTFSGRTTAPSSPVWVTLLQAFWSLRTWEQERDSSDSLVLSSRVIWSRKKNEKANYESQGRGPAHLESSVRFSPDCQGKLRRKSHQ